MKIKYRLLRWGFLWGVAALMMIASSCNRDFENRLQFQQDADTSRHQLNDGNKVLYIIVDGGIGAVLEAEALKDDLHPNLFALTKKALYSGGSVASSVTYVPTTYADMLTGVDYRKHQVTPTGTDQLSGHPAVFAVLKNSRPALRTAAFVRSSYIADQLLSGADEKEQLGSDAAVQTAAVNELKRNEASVVIAQYQGLYDAGQQFGYGPRVPEYTAAVKPFDDFLGALRTALHSRPGYSNENWLIVVASNKGGSYALYPEEDDAGPFTDTERNAFVLFANDNFVTRYVAHPNTINYQQEGYTLGLGSDENRIGSSAAVGIIAANDAAIYNFGTTGGFTVQFKANFSSLGSNSPTLLAKSSGASGNNPTGGWAIQLGGGKARLRLANVTYGGSGPTEPLNEWNTYTMRIYDSASKRYVNLYINGQLYSAPGDITGKDISTAEGLTVGGGPSFGQYSPRLRMIDIRIYSAALPDAFIRSNYCSTLINPGDPYQDKLIGYWPGMGLTEEERTITDVAGMLDRSPSGRKIIFPKTMSWTSFSLGKANTVCPTIPWDITASVPLPVDIPLFIYSWMGASNISALGLDGKSWVPSFANSN